jgi:hypothetical protein
MKQLKLLLWDLFLLLPIGIMLFCDISFLGLSNLNLLKIIICLCLFLLCALDTRLKIAEEKIKNLENNKGSLK